MNRPFAFGVATSILVTAVIGGCGFGFVFELLPPTGIVATTDQTEQITVTWEETQGANIYYVYRSIDPAGPFGTPGPYGPIPYQSVVGTTFLDIEVDPTTYYYRVSSGSLHSGAESAQSVTVTGSALAQAIGWQGAASVFGADGTTQLVVDRLASFAKAYVLTVPDDTSAGVTVRGLGGTTERSRSLALHSVRWMAPTPVLLISR